MSDLVQKIQILSFSVLVRRFLKMLKLNTHLRTKKKVRFQNTIDYNLI